MKVCALWDWIMYPEFDFKGHDLWITIRFWISSTEFYVIVNFFTSQKSKENTNQSLKFKSLWSLSRANMLMFIIYEHFLALNFIDFVLISCIEFFLVVWNCAIRKKSCSEIAKSVNIYFFLLTNCSNYFAFDKAFALLDWLKKSNSKS